MWYGFDLTNRYVIRRLITSCQWNVSPTLQLDVAIGNHLLLIKELFAHVESLKMATLLVRLHLTQELQCFGKVLAFLWEWWSAPSYLILNQH